MASAMEKLTVSGLNLVSIPFVYEAASDLSPNEFVAYCLTVAEGGFEGAAHLAGAMRVSVRQARRILLGLLVKGYATNRFGEYAATTRADNVRGYCANERV